MAFEIGEEVQIARVIGDDYPINNSNKFSSDQIEWINVRIDAIRSNGEIAVKGYDLTYPEDTWNVSAQYISVLLRKLVCVKFASNCLDCREPLTYEVPYNHKDGYICYSCSSTNGWKYK